MIIIPSTSFSLASLSIIIIMMSTASAMDFATKTAHQLEKAFIDDCSVNKQPHGFYGAYLQPCEFTFRKLHDGAIIQEDFCSDSASSIISKPIPMNWFFNMTERFHMDSSDSSWDSFSSDDFSEIVDELMLWPDQCVGVAPRCYAVHNNPAIDERLSQFFDEIPEDATHVQVNCQADAMMVSRNVYALAGGFEESMPTIIAWMVTVILFSLVASMWCCYGCFRLVRASCNKESEGHYYYGYSNSNSKLKQKDYCTTINGYHVRRKPVATATAEYVVIEDGAGEMENEKSKLMNQY